MLKARPNPRVIILAVAVLAAGALLYNWVQDRRALAAPPEGSGTVEATEIEVGPQVTGRLAAVLVNEGDDVRAGQVIARLDDRDLRAGVQQAAGQRDAALNALRNLREGSRAQQIAAARAAVAAADATVAGAERALANAETGFSHATEARQAVDAARTQVRALTSQYAAVRRQASAAAAQASGAGRARETAEQGLESVTDLRQARDAAQGQVETARAARERATSALTTARTDYERATSLFAQGAIARRDVDNARLALDTAQAGLDTAQAQVATAQATLTNASRALTERLSARQAAIAAETSSTATARQSEAAQAQVRQAAAQLAGARLALANAETAYQDRLQTRTALDAARTGVQTARAQAESARQNLSLLQAGNTAATIESARGQWKAAEGALALARRRLEEAVVRAPETGRISTVVARAGETVTAGLPVVKMIDVKHAYVRVYLPYRSFGKVVAGDAATVETDAIPNETFRGRVTELATEAEFTPKNVETRDQRLQQVYWVKVALENPDGRLKPGMPARATLANR